MEGERGVLPPIYDHANISFSAPQEMGFLQFEEHNQVFSFLSTAPAAPQPPLEGGTAVKPTTTTTNNNGSLGLNHNEFLNNRPSWNNDHQLIALESKAVNDDDDYNNEGSHSWWRNCTAEKNKINMIIRRKVRAKILFPDTE